MVFLGAQEGDQSGFRRSRAPMFGRHMTLLALQKPGAPNCFSILRPNTGEGLQDMVVRAWSCCSVLQLDGGVSMDGATWCTTVAGCGDCDKCKNWSYMVLAKRLPECGVLLPG